MLGSQFTTSTPAVTALFIEDFTAASDAELFFSQAFATHSPVDPAGWHPDAYFTVPYGVNPDIGKPGASALEREIVERVTPTIRRVSAARFRGAADRDEHLGLVIAKLLDRTQAIQRMSLCLPSMKDGKPIAALSIQQIASTVAKSNEIAAEITKGRELKAPRAKRTEHEQKLNRPQLRELRTAASTDFTSPSTAQPVWDEWDAIDDRLDMELHGGVEGDAEDINAWFRSATDHVLTAQQQDAIALYAKLDGFSEEIERGILREEALEASVERTETGAAIAANARVRAVETARAEAEAEAETAGAAAERTLVEAFKSIVRGTAGTKKSVNAAVEAVVAGAHTSDVLDEHQVNAIREVVVFAKREKAVISQELRATLHALTLPEDTEGRKRGGVKPGYRTHAAVASIMGVSQPTVSREIASGRTAVNEDEFATVVLQAGYTAAATGYVPACISAELEAVAA